MEVSEVRRRVLEVIEQSRQAAAERRTRVQDARAAYEPFLRDVATPVFRQVANALRAEGYLFTVSTPAGEVYLTSDRNGKDVIQLALDTEGEAPAVMCHVSRERGHRVLTHERPVCDGTPINQISDKALLEFLLPEIAKLVTR